MVVGDLRKQLEGLDDDLEVIISTDAEGNDFMSLDDVELSEYREADGVVEIVEEEERIEAEEDDDTEYLESILPCLILWPV